MPTEEKKLTDNAMEVDGLWAEECEDSERGGSPVGAETMFGSSTLTLGSLAVNSPGVRRSQPISIANRSKFPDSSSSSSSSAPSIPNPFPELCSPSKSPVLIHSLPPQSSDKHMIKVYGEDSHGRSLWVSPGATAREVCQMLVQTAHCTDQENWALLELHPTLGLERCLEDHEVVLEVQATWSFKGDTRLIFCKNYAKYEFFRKPMLFFPECLISDGADVGKGMASSDLILNLLRSGTCPEIQGFLHMKESSRKAWKKFYFFLRRSGLYCSTKGSSKEPRHLQCVADPQDLNVYNVVNSRKLYGAPSDFTLCIKPSRNPVRTQELKILCADNEQIRTCWTSAFRLFKHGNQLHRNYQLSKSASQSLGETRFTACKSESETSLVAMDFSGNSGGRVIQNPAEAESAEMEEGQSWKRREAMRCSQTNLSSGAKTSSIHRSQLWFHGAISRRDTQRLMEKQGLVDGLFLIRESQQHGNCFVLSLCHKLKARHYLIIPCEEDDRMYCTMDDGNTLFLDVMQLVEFHQINRGILPVCLKHPCVCVAI